VTIAERPNMTDSKTSPSSYMDADTAKLGFKLFKWGVYLLLAINVYFFYTKATLNEALDSLAWLLLVGVMEYETRSLDQSYSSPTERTILLALQAIAYAFIIKAWYTYFSLGEWLDFVNASAWLAVCALLAYDVYAPGQFGTGEWKLRNTLKIGLYALLIGCAIYWGATGEVLDFYDAFLWILAFFAIELNVFGFEKPRVEVKA
jgi:hypothetical protein